jgi:hypothetical protein
LPELLIVVVKASPMLAKLVETVLVDIFDSIERFPSVEILLSPATFLDSLHPLPVVFVLDFGMLIPSFIYRDRGHKNTIELPHCTEMTLTRFSHI